MKIPLLKESQQYCCSILLGEQIDGFIEDWPNCCQVGGAVVRKRFHMSSLFLASLATTLAAQDIACHVTGIPMQPTAQHHITRQFSRLLAQVYENRLRHVLRQMPIAADQSKCC